MCYTSIVWPNHKAVFSLCHMRQPETMDKQPIRCAKHPRKSFLPEQCNSCLQRMLLCPVCVDFRYCISTTTDYLRTLQSGETTVTMYEFTYFTGSTFRKKNSRRIQNSSQQLILVYMVSRRLIAVEVMV